MNSFTCCQRHKKENHKPVPIAQPKDFTPCPPPAIAAAATDHAPKHPPETDNQSSLKAYTFRELATATKNFRQECLLGEGGYGKVFKGTIPKTGQIVAVRQLDRNGVHPSHEFVSDVSTLSLLKQPNLVEIIGYCADGEQRILVYEYIPSGSLKNHLFELPAGRKPLDWPTRMKIALGIAEGLEFLHEKTKPSIIYRDLKSSNILLDEANSPRLSEYGLAKLVQSGGGKKHVAHSVMAGFGYGAPEYERQGEVSFKSDVYSFGIVMLELITGRRALDTSLPTHEQQLVTWAQTFFRDPSRFPDMADPLLRKRFPATSLNQAVGVAAMCLQEEPSARPLISDISAALSFLAMAPPEAPIPDSLVPILSSRVETFKFSSFNEANNVEKPDRGKDKHDKKLSSDLESESSDSSEDEIVTKSKRKHRKNKKKCVSRKCSQMSSRSSSRDHSFDYDNDSSSSNDETGSRTSESESEE